MDNRLFSIHIENHLIENHLIEKKEGVDYNNNLVNNYGICMFNSTASEKLLFQKQVFTNRFHTLGTDFYSHQMPSPLFKPELIHINPSAAKLLDHSADELNNEQFRDFACGNTTIEQSQPIAAIYAGHQFGHFVPQLGDGRALLLGEIKNAHNDYWEIQIKGAGTTPYSRQGDGRAVLRSSIREYLCSEAMYGLGIPTTRALAMVNSEEEVYREQVESGAVIVRLAPSFIRFGSFELFASRGQNEQLKKLADFVIRNYYPQILEQTANHNSNPYALFLSEVIKKTAQMIARWQAVGFAHGVMNTDNMSILGLTLDYGPFGFVDTYQRNYICNHTDHQGRYSFQNQPAIAYWNLARLAETLLSLMDIDEANDTLSTYEDIFSSHYMALMRKKLGFFGQNYDEKQLKEQQTVILALLNLMEKNQVDYTLFFRQLSNLNVPESTQAECSDKPSIINSRDLFLDREAFDKWRIHYEQALPQAPMAAKQRKTKMDKVNPKYILRNYMAQIAIEQATEQRDYSEIDKLLSVLQSPYDEHTEMSHYAGLPPEWAQKINVSCSS